VLQLANAIMRGDGLLCETILTKEEILAVQKSQNLLIQLKNLTSEVWSNSIENNLQIK